MYDKEAGVIACDICDVTIEGYGFSWISSFHDCKYAALF